MKTYIRLVAALAVGGFVASCAEQDIKEYVVPMPAELETANAVNAYDNIKDYVDYAAYPNFKIACALGADDYNAKGVVYRVANQNFDEITLGNAMKYASVVGDNGDMNFTTIKDLLDNAEAAGMSVYGHTLAWHAQQNRTYLESLLADEVIPLGPEDRIVDIDLDFSQIDSYPYSTISGSITPVVEDGVLKATCSNKKHKFYLVENLPTEEGEEYEIIASIRANKEGSVSLQFGNNEKVKFTILTEWGSFKIKGLATSDVTSLVLDPGNTKIELEISSVLIGHYPPSSRPLTDEEKVENLKNEMHRWISGMMEACDGRVKAWDMINEAISGGGDINGYYDLQHGSPDNTNDFFWQDYFGNENYGPIVSKAAREAYVEFGGNPADLKLFVNDYNLESDWDNNKKLKSLIYWVGEWEKRGATIDGLATQMHIGYYENKATMASKAKHMVNMLHLMANTGKLVRISELDMGYVDKDGNALKTQDLTAEQHQNMANYYQFIIQMYLKIVPKEQQYSICQWCLTDAPASSGWRKGEPVGLWTEDWTRKSAYVAFCEAFKQDIPATEDFFEFLQQKGLTHYIGE